MPEMRGFRGLKCPDCGTVGNLSLMLYAEEPTVDCQHCWGEFTADDADLFGDPGEPARQAFEAVLAWAQSMPVVRSETDHAAP